MPPVVKPKALKPGSHVRIVSPASPLVPEKVERGLAILKGEGYEVTLGEHVFDHDGYLAGSDQMRAKDLMDGMLDPGIDAVICSRGGYGCARLFPYLDLDKLAASGTLFCGFSDVTTLHLALNRRGLVTFHTPMLITLGPDRERWVHESFKRCLRGEDPIPADAPRAACVTPGVAEGPVTGGCLSLLTDSLATPDSLDCRGKIVLVEDVDEKPHRVDADLTQLLNSGIIQQAAGIVVGEMTRTDELAEPGTGVWPWREIVKDRLGGLGIPLVTDFPFGHAKSMLSLPFGIDARLDAGSGSLTYTDSSCA